MKQLFSKVSEAPASEPVTLAEAKAQLNIDTLYTGDDTFISSCITAARSWVELRIGQSLITQTRIQYMDRFPYADHIELLYGPVSAVTEIAYRDSNDTAQTLTTGYWLDVNRVVPRIVIENSWPSVGDRPGNVAITYTAGFGNAAAVPEPVKAAIKLLLTHLYQNRTPEVQGVVIGKLDFALESLLGPYTVIQHGMYA